MQTVCRVAEFYKSQRNHTLQSAEKWMKGNVSKILTSLDWTNRVFHAIVITTLNMLNIIHPGKNRY